MLSYSEMKKPKVKRNGEPAIINFSNDEPFDTLKAQTLLIPVFRNPFEFFEGNVDTFQLTVNCSIVYRYEAIGVE
ncbi:hypothetical protein BDR04DRAFT_1098307 [Suillus decipiens]|nr:hypothetical protein BDR04DRAFT_1098307 [Suillus decipiens]